MTFYLLTGLCGAGKTTIAKLIAQTGCRYISIDAFYCAVFGDDRTHKHKEEVWEMCYQALDLAKQDGVSVVFDTNAPTKKDRDEILEKFAQYYDKRYLVWVLADSELCKENNKNRTRVIPEDEMSKIIKNYESPTEIELVEWSDIYIIKNIKNTFSSPISLKICL